MSSAPLYKGVDPGIYISEVVEGGPAHRDGRLQFGDELLEVNGVSLAGATHQDAVDLLRACKGLVRLKVLRIAGATPAPPQPVDVDAQEVCKGP